MPEINVVVWNYDTNETLFFSIIDLPYLLNKLPGELQEAGWGKKGVINFHIYHLPDEYIKKGRVKKTILDNRTLCLLHEGLFRGVPVSKNIESVKSEDQS